MVGTDGLLCSGSWGAWQLLLCLPQTRGCPVGSHRTRLCLLPALGASATHPPVARPSVPPLPGSPTEDPLVF